MFRTIPGKTYFAAADDGGLGGSTPPPVAPPTPPAASADWESKYKGLSRTFEMQRQELESVKSQMGQLGELQGAMKTMTEQLQALAKQNAELERRRQEAEALATKQALEARKRDLIAKTAPQLGNLAGYIPTIATETEQAQAIADFVAAVNGVAVAPPVPPTPPTSSPPAPATAPTPTLGEVQQSWIDAILAGRKDEAKNLEARFTAMVNADPKLGHAFSEEVASRQGASMLLGV